MAHSFSDPTVDELRTFSLVWMRAIALTWCNDETGRAFKKRLLEAPLVAMEEYLNYRCPFAIDLEVFEPTKGGWDSERGAWHLPKNEILFGLPNKPASEFDEAIAIAEFTDGGHAYLFSCC